eukprot:scpid59116/ scgid4461/ Probable alpha-ketoglutarate-dependent dioxygenase ABH6; Alkylated DNA repair protein alkB homolog 6
MPEDKPFAMHHDPVCFVCLHVYAQWLQQVADRLSAIDLFETVRPNHVLVNEYEAGQGIMPHTDGPLYYPVVCTVNLGSHTLLDFTPRRSASDDSEENGGGCGGCMKHVDGDGNFSLLLEPCSLSVVAADLYTDYLHGIAERAQDDLQGMTVCNLDMCSSSVRNQEDPIVLQRSTRLSLTIRHVLKTVRLPLRLGLSR